MKVILLTDIPKLGRKYELKEVSKGYAQNFLLRQGKAIIADSKNKALYAEKREKHLVVSLAKKEEFLKKIEEIKEPLILTKSANEENKLFGSVNAKDISLAWQEKFGFELMTDWLNLIENIKEIGEYQIEIIDPHQKQKEVLAKISLKIEKE